MAQQILNNDSSPAHQGEHPTVPGGSRVQLRRALAALPYDEQVRAVQPPGALPPVQLKIDLTTLEDKFAEGAYSGTIDEDTDCKTANEVGALWVGEGHIQQPYGPPFKFRYQSKDGKRAYRAPMVKQSGKKKDEAQGNYEGRTGEGKRFDFNAHVSVTDIADYLETEEKGTDETKSEND